MPVNIAQVFDKIAEVQSGIAGVRMAYNGNEPPDSIEMPPAFFSYLANGRPGTIEYMVSREAFMYPVTMRLYLTKSDIRTGIQAAIPYFEGVVAAFRANVRLGGLVNWAQITEYTFGDLTYAGERFVGWEFILSIRQDVFVSPSP